MNDDAKAAIAARLPNKQRSTSKGSYRQIRRKAQASLDMETVAERLRARRDDGYMVDPEFDSLTFDLIDPDTISARAVSCRKPRYG